MQSLLHINAILIPYLHLRMNHWCSPFLESRSSFISSLEIPQKYDIFAVNNAALSFCISCILNPYSIHITFAGVSE